MESEDHKFFREVCEAANDVNSLFYEYGPAVMNKAWNLASDRAYERERERMQQMAGPRPLGLDDGIPF